MSVNKQLRNSCGLGGGNCDSKKSLSTLPLGRGKMIYIWFLEQIWNCIMLYLHNFDNAKSDVFTANDNSIGNSGGTTDVIINAHSRTNLYLLRLGSSVPETRK